MVVTFQRTNQATGEILDFTCCVSDQPNESKTPKQLYDEQVGNWVLVTKKDCHLMHIIRDASESQCHPKYASFNYDLESLVPDMTENTINGRILHNTLLWNNLPLMKYFEETSINGVGKAKRQVNGILEKVFFALPIFDPMGTQDVISSEASMYTRVVEFQTYIASL
jgi:hypothetical protein